jgi:4-hydroxy-3-methylbut-2-enyl diphosphate reductase
MVVIGGYNSSNTQALAQMCAGAVPTFHIDRPECIEDAAIRSRPLGGGNEVRTAAWLPEEPVAIGITAGASTPDSVVGDVVVKILELRGHSASELTVPSLCEEGS